jgi:lipoyl(octanoyl) transferase
MLVTDNSKLFYIEDWQTTNYNEALEKQLDYVQKRQTGVMGDTIILTEHNPVYTIGRRFGGERDLQNIESSVAAPKIPIFTTNRGGSVTYHAPGQLVVYAIMDLSLKQDLDYYLHFLEQVIIEILKPLGIEGVRRSGKTGIWIDKRKVAAIGIAVRKWIVYHGFALNVDLELSPFNKITPCGISPDEGGVTSIAQELHSTNLNHLELMDVTKRLVASVFCNTVNTYYG